MSYLTLRYILVFGVVMFCIGGLLAMRGVIKEEAGESFADHLRHRAALRRSLPRKGLCPVGLAIMLTGVLCVLTAYVSQL